MRYTLIMTILAGLVCVGCNQTPKKVDSGQPDANLGIPGEAVRPLTPPGGEAVTPPPVTSLTSLVPPEPRTATPVVTPLPPAPIAPAPAPGGTYVIKKGDTFIKIAREVYGDASRMKDIAAANPGVDPRKLQVGQTIVLPDVGPLK